MSMMRRCGLAAATVLLLAGTAAGAQGIISGAQDILGGAKNMIGGIFGGGKSDKEVEKPLGPLQTGRTRPAFDNERLGLMTEIVVGSSHAANFSQANRSIHGDKMPIAIYVFDGRAGQIVKARVTSPDTHTSVSIGRRLSGDFVAFSKYSKNDTDFNSEATGILKRDGAHYIFVSAHETNEQGGPRAGKSAQVGKFTLSFSDSDTPAAPVALTQAQPVSAAPVTMARAAAPVSSGSMTELLVEAFAAARAENPAEKMDPAPEVPNGEIWGTVAKLAGTTWANEKQGTMREYQWEIPGEVMLLTRWSAAGKSIERMALDPSGQWISSAFPADGKVFPTKVASPRPGIVLQEAIGDGKWRLTERHSEDIKFIEMEQEKDGVWTPSGEVSQFRRISRSELRAGLSVLQQHSDANLMTASVTPPASSVAPAPSSVAPASISAAPAIASAALPASSAAPLAASPAPAGASPAGSASVGAAPASPSTALAAAPSSGTAALGAAAASGGAGALTARPNLAGEACAGFTETNYRSLAMSDGNDVQLKMMCGQAFEIYSMYKRAIAQGQSEADANRTYEAHRQAALNASSFLTNNKAK